MYLNPPSSSYEEFHRELFEDRGRALTARERELFGDDDEVQTLSAPADPAPRRRAALPRWRPPALAAGTPVIASLEFEAVNGLRSVS